MDVRGAAAERSALIDFDIDPAAYRHWSVRIEPPRATLTLAVDPAGGLRDDYQLKQNSYDLGVDIELADIVTRLRFEHPEVRVVVLTGGLDRTFCAGANIQMLAGSSHTHKVGFCKFTNETRNAIEEATAQSGQVWIAAVNGTAAGGGYELALACDEILLVDDRSSAVSLPEVPLLAVLPGTGGLTRLVDKRHVRRDLADVFATRAEGVRGSQAVEWGLVDAIAPPSGFAALVTARVDQRSTGSDRPIGAPGMRLDRPQRQVEGYITSYRYVTVRLDPALGSAHVTVAAPAASQPVDPDELVAVGAGAWVVAAARELDDALLHLRFDQPELGTWVLRTEGDGAAVLQAERLLAGHADHWLVREVRLLWARTLKRLDLSSRSLVALIAPGSCFSGTLAELTLAADRTFMLDGPYEGGAEGDSNGDAAAEATLRLTGANTGWYPMANGLSRLATRCYGRPTDLDRALAVLGRDLDAVSASRAGLVTSTPDDLDWDDEVRLALEERASFSPDALTAMEANLRFVGPETMETKIFARLTAWQNWVFQRPNATGPNGALQRFGSGSRPDFDRTRV